VRTALLSTPRPAPGRRAPALAGALVVALALPVCLAGGFSLSGWVLAAVLWAAAEVLGVVMARIPTGADNLGRSGLVALTMSFRGIGVMVVLIAVTLASRSVGITALVIYVLAYSLSLGVSLVEYFGGGGDR
jgi:hypothetical protein